MSDATIDILDTIGAVQEGDNETLQTVLANRLVNSNAKDKDGCSLLHWAAINNRITIASLLIEYGANSEGGGVLNESPLQWALRRKYYTMAQLLVEQLHVDLRHKSSQGLDALHLSCRLGDINAIYLLLHWGANPNTLDNDGDTPLLFLMRGDYSSLKGEIARLLVRFGADVTVQDRDKANSVFHLLSRQKNVDLSLALFLYQTGSSQIPLLKNANGLTPYEQSIYDENRIMAAFLFDAFLLNYFPFWIPSVFTGFYVVLSLVLINLYGYIFGGLYNFIILLVLYFFGVQKYIVDYRSRVWIGCYYSLFLCFVVNYLQAISPFVSVLLSGLSLTLFAVTGYVGYKIVLQKPLATRANNKSELARQIIESSPSEGTDEENELPVQGNSGGRKRVKILKDSFTGRVQVVHLNESQSECREIRVRSLGPRICGFCLCDKRLLKLRETKTRKEGDHNDRLAVLESGLKTENSESYISIATHCNFCGSCYVDVDHHCNFLGVCIGIGNRRLFLFYLSLVTFSLMVYFCTSRWVAERVYCSGYSSYSRLLELFWVESCLLQKRKSYYVLQFAAFLALIYFAGSLILQLILVGREAVLLNAFRTRLVNPPPVKKQLKLIWKFIRTGAYSVVYPPLESFDESSETESCKSPVLMKEQHPKLINEDEYDREYTESQFNNFQARYYNSSDEEEFEDASESNSDEESLIRVRR